MARRVISALGFVALGLAVGTSLDALGQTDKHDHAGRVIEFGTGKPLVVSVKAWPNSQRSGRDGDCSLYGDAPLDARTSDPDGGFQLSVPSDSRTYTVTYCATGYVPRDDKDIPNDPGAAILPTPVTLWTADSGTTAEFDVAVRRRLISSLNEIAYLRRIDAERFGQSAGTLVEDVSKTNPQQAVLVRTFAGIAQSWDQ